MIGKVTESNWIHRVTRQIVRAKECPGPDYDRVLEPWEPRRDPMRDGHPAPDIRVTVKWMHRVTRNIVRSPDCPGPGYDPVPESDQEQARRKRATRPYNPMRHGLEE